MLQLKNLTKAASSKKNNNNNTRSKGNLNHNGRFPLSQGFTENLSPSSQGFTEGRKTEWQDPVGYRFWKAFFNPCIREIKDDDWGKFFEPCYQDISYKSHQL